MWFIFRLRRKMNHIPLFCERSLFTSRKPSGGLNNYENCFKASMRH
ncbi:MAG: hypothetical protein U5L45_02595 [Saprospiraceae bacterium]|nr:hypothetical protein [Saprospiraceae bacterium]